MRSEQVAFDIELLIGDTYNSNALVIRNGHGVLVVDAMASDRDARRLRDHLRTRRLDVRFMVVTHYFSDHIAALKWFPAAEVIAHRAYRETFNVERYRTAEEAGHYVEPTILVDDSLTLRWGSYELNLFHNPGHTASTLAVDIEGADLIHGGDTVVGNIVYFQYAEPAALYPALDRLAARGRRRLVSSHGSVRSADAIRTAREYLDRVLTSTSLEQPLTPFEQIFHRRNLDRLSCESLSLR